MKFFKRSFEIICFLCLVVCIFTSCDEEIVDGDYGNHEMKFEILDPKTGLDLLNPYIENNILNEKMWVEYNGEIYDAIVFPNFERINTRFNAPREYALRITCDNFIYDDNNDSYIYNGRWYLGFGDFQPLFDYKNQEFILHIGDNFSLTVRFDCYISNKKKNGSKIIAPVWIDGIEYYLWNYRIYWNE